MLVGVAYNAHRYRPQTRVINIDRRQKRMTKPVVHVNPGGDWQGAKGKRWTSFPIACARGNEEFRIGLRTGLSPLVRRPQELETQDRDLQSKPFRLGSHRSPHRAWRF